MQLHNLALCQPIMQMEALKNDLIRDGSKLLTGIDTRYLALTLIEYLMSESFFRRGASREEAAEHLAPHARQMKPSLSDDEANRVAFFVFDHLANAKADQSTFKIDYWDAARSRWDWHEFRLLEYRQVDSEQWLWTATQDGLMLLLSMLSIDPELTAEIEKAMLERLIEQGRVEDAAALAERARIESFRFHQDIDRQIFWAARGERVDWAKIIAPRIGDARVRIRKRAGLDENVLDAIRERLHLADPDDRGALVRMRRILEECQETHTRLDTRLNSAWSEYLDHQASEFALRQDGMLVDPEDVILRPLLRVPLTAITPAVADTITAALGPMRVRHLPQLVDLLDMAMVAPPERTPPPEGPDDIDPYAEPVPTFDREVERKVKEWFQTQVQRDRRINTEALLLRAAAEEFTRDEILCLALTAMFEIRDVEDATGFGSRRDGVIAHEVVSGDRIEYFLKEDARYADL